MLLSPSCIYVELHDYLSLQINKRNHLTNLQKKYYTLKTYIGGFESLLVAYSGGVDSALVLKVAHDVLGDKTVAVTADSHSVPRREIAIAKKIAVQIGSKHLIVQTDEIDDENYSSNPVNRCYFCKSELYTKLQDVAKAENITTIANGTNLDDLGDYRPGLQAANELKVVSPLKEAEMTKTDVRELAQQLGLEIWDKPAAPCLASRIPYQSAVTPEKLAAIEQAEYFLKDLDIKDLRVRHFGEKARIELHENDIAFVESKINFIKKKFKTFGFEEIELGLFKSGSLNNHISQN